MPFTLKSAAFEDGDTIPQRFTCDGADEPPPLAWSGPPKGTASLALIMDDPDAPAGTFTHWMVYDIPASTRQGVEASAGRSLRNDFGRSGYGGPCPPPGHGPHRYFFTLYALDVATLDLRNQNRAALERAIERHTLGTVRLMGRYER